MNDPIKVIFKYKNNNRRVQYATYIFIGKVPNNIKSILTTIQNLSLYDSFIKLSKDDITTMESFYGDLWYKKFFNTYHINFMMAQINKDKTKQSELIKSKGQKWYDKYIVVYKLVENKLIYNYSTIIKDELLMKEHKKHRIAKTKEIDNMDFKDVKRINIDELSRMTTQDIILSKQQDKISSNTEDAHELQKSNELQEGNVFNVLNEARKYQSNDVFSILHAHNRQTGGSNNFVTNVLNKMDKYDNNVDIKNVDVTELQHTYSKLLDKIGLSEGGKDVGKDVGKDAEEQDVEDFETVEESVEDDDIHEVLEEEFDTNDLDKIYQDMDVKEDPNISKTSDLIKQALNDDNVLKNIKKSAIDFDESKNNLMYDDTLKNLFIKNYVTSQYIFKDDTVKTVKNKICVTVKNSSIYGHDQYIMPSRQYLWSEYIFEDKVEKIMIGQKWIRRSELLSIDVEINNNIRYYEDLRGNLKLLKDNLKRHGSKIKREDDDFNILYDYERFYTNNELYLLDIYNDLGKNYNPDAESLKNIIDVYRGIYFPRIRTDDIKNIVDYLNGDGKVEQIKMKNTYDTIMNDLIIENEIIKIVEKTKLSVGYKKLFKDRYITHSVIHVNLRTNDQINLYRIFTEFEINDQYPFIQYQTFDGQIIFKFNQNAIDELSQHETNVNILSKWFENSPYGVSFKMKIGLDKYMVINLSDLGRIEYKTQWREDDKATLNSIYDTYDIIRELVKKINEGDNKVVFIIPHNDEFKYAFINTIQQFELPEKFVINHNDLSEFARFFFPFVVVVIEPRKRESKMKESGKGKFGTYLRYKRVSKYENQSKIEQRILYLLRNYEYTEQLIVNEITKQFNITVERANEEIDRVKNKYPNIKKSRKILKKMDALPKYKPPGIGIDIQGKQRDRYKIRVSGARDAFQLDKISSFYNIFIYLYTETYLYKKPEMKSFKEKLLKLTNIAKRRNKVEDVVDYEKSDKVLKQMEKVDNKRLGFTPDKGQNPWSKSCQNSGILIRQPHQHTSLDELLALGFKYNKGTNTFEKKTVIKGTGETIIRALRLDTFDDDGNKSGYIYYSCNPDHNNDHPYVGFLSKSVNPYGQCMPCCFKKDVLLSSNKDKVEHFNQCATTSVSAKNQNKDLQIVGNKLYILQDTNKIQSGRIGFLPKYLDAYLNRVYGNVKKMKQHYLLSSKNGYFFKYGVSTENQYFLNAVAVALDMNLDEIINLVVNRLENDKSDVLFTYLNNGDIKTAFDTKDNYVKHIKTSVNLSFDVIYHIISTPDVIKKHGLNIIIFKKEIITIKKALEKEKSRDDFFIMCQNNEEIDNIKNPLRMTLIMINENKIFYPIVFVKKEDEYTKEIHIKKNFKYGSDGILEYVYDFYERNCKIQSIGQNLQYTAKKMYGKLVELGIKEYMPVAQMVDARNKCKYIVTQNDTIISTNISGSIYNLRLIKKIDDKLMSLDDTIDKLKKLHSVSKGKVEVEPIGVYYNFKHKGVVNCVGVMTQLKDIVPVIQVEKSVDQLTKMGLEVEYKQLFDYVDVEIAKGVVKIDERITNVVKNKYEKESYELFRFHLSAYLNNVENESTKKKIMKAISDKDIDKKVKRDKIRRVLFKIIDAHLYALFEETMGTNKEGDVENVNRSGYGGKIVYPITKEPDLLGYEVDNNRSLCSVNKSKDVCSTNKHCYWAYDKCQFALVKETIVTYVNKISEEFANDDHKTKELLNVDGYYVADIVDYNNFGEKPGQKIIKSTNKTIGRALEDIFGKDNIPKIGRRKVIKSSMASIQELNEMKSIYDMGDFYTQEIIENNLTLLRAFANGYIWLKQLYYDVSSRNLGFFTESQTDIANYFRSNILEWLIDYGNQNMLKKEMELYIDTGNLKFVKDFISKITRDSNTNTDGLVEYYILNKIYNIVVIIYDNYNSIMYVIDDGVVYDKQKDGKVPEKYVSGNIKKFIHIRYAKVTMSQIPTVVEVAYYK